ncbi:5'-nucleotidase, lipoprotein e(P4) family [Orenia marismortui]|uniref:Acid phosphatase n=1 Tax=Orenia marismortui TaxID=46469 RepID=A0A4R8GYI0_9FIRM|nr:5'-nucleotidase, lipoprotein e(P4) family [Orenia marismortui]TDX51396.1 acid phosphatase [Orenia marismortui]
MKRRFTSKYLILFLVGITIAAFGGCTQQQEEIPKENNQAEYKLKDLNEQLVMGTLWYQTAAEMRALSYQAFNMAKLIFDNDLKNNTSREKRAVIVDVDETVLDNSPYEAYLVGKNISYPKGWDDWINSAQAKALPGAIDFLNYVVDNGGDVFYITNRKSHLEDATVKNLQDLKFPQADSEHVLTRTDTSDKEPRRQVVDQNHRIILLMGDNLNDFKSAFADKRIQERFDVVDQYKGKFGEKFILLPNPMYGEWEGAVYDYNWDRSPEAKSKARKENLKQWKNNE